MDRFRSAITGIPQLETIRSDSYSLSPTEIGAYPPILITMPKSGVYLFDVCVPFERAAELQTVKRRPGALPHVCHAKLFHVK